VVTHAACAPAPPHMHAVMQCTRSKQKHSEWTIVKGSYYDLPEITSRRWLRVDPQNMHAPLTIQEAGRTAGARVVAQLHKQQQQQMPCRLSDKP